MTTIPMTNDRIATAVHNGAVEFARTRPSAAPEPVSVELKKLAQTVDGSYAVVSNGTLSKAPTVVADNPTKMVGGFEAGDEMRVVMEAVMGEGDGATAPMFVLWQLLLDWAMKNRPNAGECRTLSRGVNTLAAARKGIVVELGDLP